MAELINNILFIFQRFTWLTVIDLFLVTMIFWGMMLFIRNTRAMVLVRGVFLLFIFISLLTIAVDLPAFSWLVNTTLPALLFAIPVIFAPEIRRALERLGRAGFFMPTRQGWKDTGDVISSVVRAARRLSTRRHGALIVLERLDTLEEYVETGVVLDAALTPELLLQIFYPNTPLHDGAVIASGNKIIAAAAVMPLSASGVLTLGAERKMGLRHRAALGTSEVSDAVAIVISEETGVISIATDGKLFDRLDAEKLEAVLRTMYKPLEPKGWFEKFMARWLPGWAVNREIVSKVEEA